MCIRQFLGQTFILSFPSISVIDSNGASVNCLIGETIGVTRWSGLRPPASDAQISKRAVVAYLVSEFIVESPLSMPAAVALVAHRYRIRSRPSRRATAPRVYARRLIVVFAAALAPDPASAAVALARSPAAAAGAGVSYARASAVRAPAHLLRPHALRPLSYTLRPLSHRLRPPMPLRSISLLLQPHAFRKHHAQLGRTRSGPAAASVTLRTRSRCTPAAGAGTSLSGRCGRSGHLARSRDGCTRSSLSHPFRLCAPCTLSQSAVAVVAPPHHNTKKFAAVSKDWRSRIARRGAGIWRVRLFSVEYDQQRHATADPGTGGLWTREEDERAGGGGPIFRIALSV